MTAAVPFVPPRLGSLDLVRGLMLVASVSVNSLFTEPEWFAHAAWEGVHPVDLIFPVFVTLTGCGLGFALHRRVQLGPLLRRVLVLLLVGLIYNAVALNSWQGETWWFTGVLQLYAGVVAVIGLGHLVTRRWWGWAIITGVLTAGYTVLLAVWAAGCPGLVLTSECNPSGVVDPAVFGAVHIYHQGAAGHDPVGLTALLGALISASAGATAGHLLLALRDRPSGRRFGVAAAVLPLLGVTAGLTLAALLAVALPELAGGTATLVMKRLWTPPFALAVAAGTTLALLAGHLVMDRRRVGRFVRAWSWPLVALGRNSLLVYFGSHALMSVLTRPDAGGGSVALDLAEALAVDGRVQLTWTLVVLAFWVLTASILHRMRVYLRP